MTRKEILEIYTVDEDGVIKNPGKFEGEMLYVPYFYNLFLEGEADDEGEDWIRFDLIPEDKEMFPELKGAEYISLWLRDDGFVQEIS